MSPAELWAECRRRQRVEREQAEIDAKPPDEQWPLREILKHMLGAEYGFLAAILTALDAARSGRPSVPDEAAFKAHRRPGEDPSGSRDDALTALYRSHVTILRALDGVTDTELATPSWFWEDKGYSIRFRMHRFEEHMRQHTIQVDKTLAALGHPPTEAERLVRNLHTALAGVESVSGAGVGTELLNACAASIDAIADEVERISR